MDEDLTPLQGEPITFGEAPQIAQGNEFVVAAANPPKSGTLISSPPKMITYGKGWPAMEVSSVTSVISLGVKDGKAWTTVLSIFVIKAYATPDANGAGFATFLFDAGGNNVATAGKQMTYPCGSSSVSFSIDIEGPSVYNTANTFNWGVLNGKMVANCF